MTGDAADDAIEVAEVTATEATDDSELRADSLAELAKRAVAEDEVI